MALELQFLVLQLWALQLLVLQPLALQLLLEQQERVEQLYLPQLA